MAITFTQQPGAVNFSNNPILLTAKTSLSGKVFLRIVCEVSFSTADGKSYKEMYASPVADNGSVVFNLSNASKVLYNQILREINSPDAKEFRIETLTAKCYEKWLEKGIEKTGSETSIQGDVMVIPGGLTDYERMTMTNKDIEQLMGNAKWLSRKPRYGGVVSNGEEIILPYFSKVLDQYNHYDFNYGDSPVISNKFVSAEKTIGYMKHVVTDTANEGSIHIFWLHGSKTFYIRNSMDEKTKQLRFINGFGVIENISVCVNDALEYEIETEGSTLIGEPSFTNINRRMTRKTSDTGIYSLSSGYVNNEWAEWFTHELLMTPKAWMSEGNAWVPGEILPDDSVQMYDRTKPGLQKVDFTFKRGIEGGTVNSYLRLNF